MPHINDDPILNNAAWARLRDEYRFPEPVFVTRPTMPSLAAYTEILSEVWESRWLTNNAAVHERLERALREYLGVEHLALFSNGTLALLIALQALGIEEGEVITTPFTFPATPHVILWNRLRPVFCDIEPDAFNLDPARVEAAITPATRAILPVHVYGNPCRVEALEELARKRGIPVVYDAAHTFGARYRGRALSAWGDMAMLSFHATKLFTTGEGGALVCRDAELLQRVRFFKNFGIADEETVIGPGINGKMCELQAAFGLLQLGGVDNEIARRRAVAEVYRSGLAGIPGIRIPAEAPETQHNYAYFPILVDPERYALHRDDLYTRLRECNVITRKYFHPLCSHIPCYAGLPSAAPANLPVAEEVARRILCLPIYGALDLDDAARICGLIRRLHEAAGERKFV